MLLQKLVNEHVLDPKNPSKMFKLAREYDKLDQGAAAISFYIRAADIEEKDTLLQYQCMLFAGRCYDRQGDRRHTVFGFYQHAVALMIGRPEAYFLLANEYSKSQDWRNCLIMAKHGMEYSKVVESNLLVGYPGEYGLRYLIALAKWKINGGQEARLDLFDLKYKTKMDSEYIRKVDQLLQEAKIPDLIPYVRSDIDRYKFPFKNIECITQNYAKHFQDMFVLSCHNGKRNGSYLEIGSGHPFIHNNTALLESEFGWRGISIDINEELTYMFSRERSNTILCMSATEIDYKDLLRKHCFDNVIDYLQVDVDEVSCQVLKKLPFGEYKFGVITFEHDGYSDNALRVESREILLSHGYVLVGKNIAYNTTNEYEDWYVHPDVVQIDENMECEDKLNFVWNYMMKDMV